MLKKERVVAREYRNRKIGGFLKELKLTEGRGTGLPIIYSSLEKNGSPPPIFETDDDNSYFLSIIKIHPLSKSLAPIRAKDGAKDKILTISTLGKKDNYLRPFENLEENKVEDSVKNYLSTTTLNLSTTDFNILLHCIKPRTREEIFKFIALYNNSKNFNRHIKPIIDIGWLQLTIPEKPTSKNQKYVISEYAKKLIANSKNINKRIAVDSPNIASVGYDRENRILEIEFHHGDVYQYFNVPGYVYNELMNASSIGSYFINEIKKKYNYKKE